MRSQSIQVLDAVRRGLRTRQDIARELGVHQASLNGRVRGLIRSGFLREYSTGRGPYLLEIIDQKPVERRRCPGCRETFALENFWRNASRSSGLEAKCKTCSAARAKSKERRAATAMRARARRRNPETAAAIRLTRGAYVTRNPNKKRAHGLVSQAVKSGRLSRQSCDCGSDNTHAHHDDYAQPLVVRWLCPPCHKAWHSKNGPGLNG